MLSYQYKWASLLLSLYCGPPQTMNTGRHSRYEPRANQNRPNAPDDQHFDYTLRAFQESPEPSVPLTTDVVRRLPNDQFHYRQSSLREGYFPPVPEDTSYGDSHILTRYTLASFHSQGETEWPSGQSTVVARSPSGPSPSPDIQRRSVTQGRVEYIPTWLENQASPPSDAHLVQRSGQIIVPSFEHSGMAQSYAQHPYNVAYERSHVPAWRELQYSGEFRRKEMDARVLRDDYVRTTSPVSVRGQGSQSSGSANSLSSGGATAGSLGWTGQDATAECEFCGRTELLSTLKDHWLGCKYRTAVQASKQGVWMNH